MEIKFHSIQTLNGESCILPITKNKIISRDIKLNIYKLISCGKMWIRNMDSESERMHKK